MISLDKAIEFYNGYKERSGGTVDYNEFDEQMVKWLEELKSYKEKHEGWMWDEAEIKGYNKAIDDFAERLKPIIDEKIKGWTNSDDLRIWCERSIDEISEQLKAGGENGTYNQ